MKFLPGIRYGLTRISWRFVWELISGFRGRLPGYAVTAILFSGLVLLLL